MKVGLIECGPVPDEFVSRFGNTARWIEQLLGKSARSPVDVRSYLAYENALPGAADTADVWIIGGSAHSVTEQTPWMLALQAWIRATYRTTKIVGICFGHQIVAKAFDGEVGRSSSGWHAGIETYKVDHHPSWMRPEAGCVNFVASHQDEVLKPPTGARVLGGNAACRNGMLLIEDRIFTIQLHPEMTTDCSALMLERGVEKFGPRHAEFRETLAKELSQPVFSDWVIQFAGGS